jgi:hypothetical protein
MKGAFIPLNIAMGSNNANSLLFLLFIAVLFVYFENFFKIEFEICNC